MTIREIAEKTGVSTYTLRYYERIGLLPPVHRRENGIRDYTEQDAERIYCIQNLKASGMPLKKILKYIELTGAGDTARQKRKTILLEAREALQKKMDDLRSMLEKADLQLLRCDSRVPPKADRRAYIAADANWG